MVDGKFHDGVHRNSLPDVDSPDVNLPPPPGFCASRLDTVNPERSSWLAVPSAQTRSGPGAASAAVAKPYQAQALD